jgi:ankyrin repeat protein
LFICCCFYFTYLHSYSCRLETIGCTDTKENETESDIDRYHQQILIAVITGYDKRLKDILDELDECKSSTTKKEVLNMGYQEADGLTALSIAAGNKHKDITEILATCAEVDVNKPSLSGITPLLMVAEVGWPDILDILLTRGAVVDSAPSGKRAEDNKIAGSTPLIGATKYNHPECVKHLLAQHANPNHQNQSGISALMLAAEHGYFECVKLLVQAAADLELAPTGELALKMNLSGQTPLFCAAKEGKTDIVEYLLDRGANPRVQNHYGISALWIPAQKGMLQVVELLLNAGAETHVVPFGNLADELNITGWTPLYAAMKSRKFDVVKLLLKRGADPNAVTKLGSTPFLLASEICDLDIIEACVEAGVDLDYAPSGPDADSLNITGQTALFMATLKDRVDVVKFLIQKGAQVNVQNLYGVSPLLLCAESGNHELVQALAQAGADVNITPQGELAEENFLAGQVKIFV